jgi:hypothetical protein
VLEAELQVAKSGLPMVQALLLIEEQVVIALLIVDRGYLQQVQQA